MSGYQEKLCLYRNMDISYQTLWLMQEKNWILVFWVEMTFKWYENDMVFHVFNFSFLFRTNFKKGYLDDSDLRHCYGHYFESAILKVTWSQLCPKFLLNNCEAHWWHSCEVQLKILSTWINIHDNSFIKTWVSIMKRKSMKVCWKL